LSLTLGDDFLIAWQDAGSDYSELSLGLRTVAAENIFWLVSNDKAYTKQNYGFTVQLGNNITLDQGNIFEFVLVNVTDFGELVASPRFTIAAKGSSVSSSSTVATTTSTSAQSSASPTTTTTTTTTTPLRPWHRPQQLLSPFLSPQVHVAPLLQPPACQQAQKPA
jgi:hypothetical protein